MSGSDSSERKILILLAGGLWHDSRVLKVANFLSVEFEVTIWTFGPEKPHPNCKVVSLPIISRFLEKVLSRTLFWLTFHKRAKQALDHGPTFDLIWANDLNTLYTGAKIAKKHGAFLIYDSHEIFIETLNQQFPTDSAFLKRMFHRLNCRLMKAVGKKMESEYIRRADLVFSANESFSRHLENVYRLYPIKSLYNLPERKINIENGSRAETISGSKNRISILYHGIFGLGRGLELILDALAILPQNYNLIFLGKGSLEPTLKNKVNKLGLSERVKFIGMVPESELIEYIASLQVLVGLNILEQINISKWLASPNKLFQYINAHIPVVCSKSPENLKVLKKFDVGVEVQNSPNDIAEGIQKVYALVKQGHKFEFTQASDHYSWDTEKLKIKDGINTLYEK